jgi:hypothetical protein
MSVKIHIESVSSILLVDGWHTVHKNSFEVNTFEFLGKSVSMRLGERGPVAGQEKLSAATGAKWVQPDGIEVFCPLAAILAVRYSTKEVVGKAVNF